MRLYFSSLLHCDCLTPSATLLHLSSRVILLSIASRHSQSRYSILDRATTCIARLYTTLVILVAPFTATRPYSQSRRTISSRFQSLPVASSRYTPRSITLFVASLLFATEQAHDLITLQSSHSATTRSNHLATRLSHGRTTTQPCSRAVLQSYYPAIESLRAYLEATTGGRDSYTNSSSDEYSALPFAGANHPGDTRSKDIPRV